MDQSESRHVLCLPAYYLILFGLGFSRGCEGILQVGRLTDSDRTVDCRKIEISPVYAQVVALLVEDGLLDSACFGISHALEGHQRGDGRLLSLVHCDFRRGFVI